MSIESTKMNFDVDFLVIGAGPAGLQLGYGLERIGANYQILESANEPASFFRRMPRFRSLISFNKRRGLYEDPETALRWDWNSLLCDGQLNFGDYSEELYPSADDLVRYLEDFAERFVHRIRYGVRVMQVDRDPRGGFQVRTQDGGSTWARVVVLATGFGAPYVPEIPGIEVVEESYETADLDRRSYEGQTVLILGKGNSAFEVADHILPTASLVHLASPRPIRFAWQTRHAGHLRANYTHLLDTYQLKLLNSVLDCEINRLWKDGEAYGVELTYTHAEGEVDRLRYDRVICCTGFRADLSFLGPSCAVEMAHDGRLPALEPDWQVKGQPGLYVAGTLMQSNDFQRAATAFVDGFRYNVRSLLHLLRERYLDAPMPSQALPPEPEPLVSELLAWVCRTSALWAQFGHLCDVVLVDEAQGDRRSVTHVKELPVDLVPRRYAEHPHLYQITFEWGEWEGDVFAIDRRPRHAAAHTSAFLHPVIRRLSYGKVVDEHHMLEDLFGMWRHQTASSALIDHNGRDAKRYHEEEHIRPLVAFFEKHLEPTIEPLTLSPSAQLGT